MKWFLKLHLLQKVAIIWIVLAIGFIVSFALWMFSFPEPYDRTSLYGQLLNDFNIRPDRFLRTYPTEAKLKFVEVPVKGLNDRREKPLLYLSPDAPRGYRILYGAFDFASGEMWGAILIGPDGELLHQWKLSTNHLKLNREPEFRKYIFGSAIWPDKSIIFNMQDTGGGIVKVDACGKPVWNLDGLFHHSISPTVENRFWTFEGHYAEPYPRLALIDRNTGEIVKRIDLAKVREANPQISIFDLQAMPDTPNATHANDIEPLPAELAADFPQFKTGDLLLSFHTTNLVFVVDPDTLKIKWWRVGAWDRQHDPDWNPGGYISVFNNNTRGVGRFSSIVATNPLNIQSTTRLDGSRYEFYSSFNGTHQITRERSILITSSTQGRVFEVNENGDVVFEFVNTYSKVGNKALHMAEAAFLPLNFFDNGKAADCDWR